jgi:hypothetical protein
VRRVVDKEALSPRREALLKKLCSASSFKDVHFSSISNKFHEPSNNKLATDTIPKSHHQVNSTQIETDRAEERGMVRDYTLKIN